jgi:hypothetical protein
VPTPIIFESLRHGYRATVPAGWSVSQYEGTWEQLDQFSPGSEVPGEDVIHPAMNRTSFVVLNSMEIPAAMSDVEWLAEFDAAVQAGLPQGCSVETTADTLAGEPATLVRQVCPDAVYLGRSLTHAGRGYYFTTRAPLPDQGLQAILSDLISSITFLP